VRLKMIR